MTTAQLALFRGRRVARTPCLALPQFRGRRGARRPLPSLLGRRAQIVLGLDVAARTGWSLWHSGQLVASGSCAPARAGPVVQRALDLAHAAQLRLVVVAEKPWSRGRTAQGLAAAWGAWAVQLQQAGHCMRHVVRVAPATWQARVLGGARGLSVPGEAKRRSRLRARQLLGREPPDDDIADACCIGLWATQGATR